MTTNIAKAEAQAMIMIAEAEAKANDLLFQSLNSNLLDKMYFEKWDGKLPTIYDGDGMTPIVQVS